MPSHWLKQFIFWPEVMAETAVGSVSVMVDVLVQEFASVSVRV
jgi:hypothetical protein